MPIDLTLNPTTEGSQERVSVAALRDGSFVAVWDDTKLDAGFDGFTGIRGQRYTADGRPIGAEFKVHVSEFGQQFGPRVVALPDGGYVVGWTSEAEDPARPGSYLSGLDTMLRRFDAQGRPVTGELRMNRVNDDDHRLQDLLALPGGGYTVTYVSSFVRTDWTLLERRFAANGAPLGGERVLDTDMDVGTPQAFVNNTPGFRVTPLPGGGYGAAWWEFAPYPNLDEVYYQRFAPNGTRLGQPTLVSTPSPDDANYPEIATLANGDVAIAWTVENDDDLDDDEVWVRVLSADGVPRGQAVRVNAPTPESDTLGDIVALPGGGFVVTFSGWDEANTDFPYEYYTIGARLFGPRGQPLGGPVIVSEFSYEDAGANDAVLLPSGGVLFTWTAGASIEEDVYGGILGGGTFAADVFSLVTPGAARGFGGNDRIGGSAAADRIAGDDGNDQLRGLGGNDRLTGGNGLDQLAGGAGRDLLEGGPGNDRLYGQQGNDLLGGGFGQDRMDGGAGNDALDGGWGADRLVGGTGADRFIVASLAQIGAGEAILDLETVDRIDLAAIDADPGAVGNQAFRFRGGAGFTGAGGEVRFGAGALLFDVDGDRVAERAIQLPGADAVWAFMLAA